MFTDTVVISNRTSICSTSVNSDDFLLVVKAFERMRNREIIYCPRHKDEGLYFIEEEIAIRDYESYLELTGNQKLHFNMESIMELNNENSTTWNLKRSLTNLSTPKALAWCGRQLLNHHSENQCQLHMLSALKFYLKSFEIVKKAYFYDDVSKLTQRTLQYLKIAFKHRLHQNAYLECLRVFCLPIGYCPNIRTLVSTEILDYVLRIEYEAKIDVLSAWRHESFNRNLFSESFQLFYYSLFRNIQNIYILIKYGKTECLSLSSYCCWCSAYKMLPRTIPIVHNSPKTVRSLQTLYLYMIDHLDLSQPFSTEHVLKLFWNSITDPYLNKEDFYSSFLPENSEEADIVQSAWNWYAYHVLYYRSLPRSSPRSLRHLSRYCIRNQMAACFKLPFGVESIPIPNLAKKYLLLKDCVSSLFTFN